MTFKSNDTRARISVRVSDDEKERFREAVDAGPHGSQSDALRSLVAEYIDRHGDGDDPRADGGSPSPADPTLAGALDALREVAGPAGIVPTDLATSTVAERERIPSAAVRPQVLKPLEEAGYIQPKWGRIAVHGAGRE